LFQGQQTLTKDKNTYFHFLLDNYAFSLIWMIKLNNCMSYECSQNYFKIITPTMFSVK
jgi:hypothetical protein